MKRTRFFPALVALLTLSTAQLFSQKTIEWKGGFPGHETDWACPQNWSGNTVPNEFSDVIIPDVSTQSRALPVIKSGSVAVRSLSVDAGSIVFVSKGAGLLIFGWGQFEDPASIRAEGRFRVLDETSARHGTIAVH